MRNTLLLALAVFGIVVAGSLCVTWFLQASSIKRNIEEAIAAANAKGTYFTYESIETSGFPTQITVSIVKPRFKGRVDQWLAAWSPPGEPLPPIPEWSEDITLDGNITLGINALSSRYTLGLDGNWHSSGSIGGRTVAMRGQSTGDMMCTLETRRGGWFDSLWSLRRLKDSEAWKDFRLLDCVWPDYTVSEAATGARLMSGGLQRLYLSRDIVGGREHARLYVKGTDAEVTVEGDEAFTVYMNALSPHSGIPVKLSVYGKQNVEMDFSYEGALDRKNLQAEPFTISVGKMNLSNQVYTTSNRLYLSHAVEGDQRTARITLASESVFGEQYDALIQVAVSNLIAEINEEANPRLAHLKPVMQSRPVEEWQMLIMSAIPNFHSLGKMVAALEANYQGSATWSPGTVTLSGLKISAAPYGITGKGTARNAPGKMPAVDLALNCRNCLRLIDDTTAYYDRVKKVAAAFNEKQVEAAPLDPKLVEGVKQFLSELATPDPIDRTTFTYAIVSDGMGSMTVNGRQMNEVMALYNQYIAPFVQKPAAPTALPLD